jgi:hypothetical protein
MTVLSGIIQDYVNADIKENIKLFVLTYTLLTTVKSEQIMVFPF